MIVDDEPLAVKLLESFVAKTPDLELLGSFTDSVEAISAIKEQKPNLLFLDIQMPDLNGMELAHMLPEGTRVIFTTAFKEYAFESYEVSALDFLLKPIRYNKFILAVEKAKRSLQASPNPSKGRGDSAGLIAPSLWRGLGEAPGVGGGSTLFLKVDGEYRQVSFDKILYKATVPDRRNIPGRIPHCRSGSGR